MFTSEFICVCVCVSNINKILTVEIDVPVFTIYSCTRLILLTNALLFIYLYHSLFLLSEKSNNVGI